MKIKTIWIFLLMVPLVGAAEPPLRVGVMVSRDFAQRRINPDGSSTLVGPGAEFLDWISRYAKFNVELVLRKTIMEDLKEILPKKPNSTEPDYEATQIEDIAQVVDFLLGPFGVYPEFFVAGDTTIISTAIVYMITQYPQEDAKIWAFVTPFTATVWACIGCAASLVGVVLHIMNRFSSPRNSFSAPYMYLLQIVLAQGGSVSTRKFCFLLVASTWCVGALILSNVYLSLVVTAFAAPLRKPVAQTIEEFHDKNLLPVLITSSHPEYTFRNSPPGSMLKTIHQRSKNETNCNFSDDGTCLNHLLQNPYSAMFLTEAIIPPLVLDDYKASKMCRVTPFPTDITAVFSTWYLVRKNHPLAHRIKLAALRSSEYDLRGRFMDFGRDTVCHCCNWKDPSTKLSKLKLSDVLSVFAILGVCYFVSFVVFVVEVIRGRRLKLRRTVHASPLANAGK